MLLFTHDVCRHDIMCHLSPIYLFQFDFSSNFTVLLAVIFTCLTCNIRHLIVKIKKEIQNKTKPLNV